MKEVRVHIHLGRVHQKGSPVLPSGGRNRGGWRGLSTQFSFSLHLYLLPSLNEIYSTLTGLWLLWVLEIHTEEIKTTIMTDVLEFNFASGYWHKKILVWRGSFQKLLRQKYTDLHSCYPYLCWISIHFADLLSSVLYSNSFMWYVGRLCCHDSHILSA